MTELSRRAVLAGTAAAAVATTLGPLPVTAQAAAGNMNGVFRHTLGDAEVIQILDGIRAIKFPPTFITNLSKDQTEAAFTNAYMPGGIFRNPYCPSVVKSGGKTIVIDTGNGIGAIEKTKGEVGHHRANLAAAGKLTRKPSILC